MGGAMYRYVTRRLWTRSRNVGSSIFGIVTSVPRRYRVRFMMVFIP